MKIVLAIIVVVSFVGLGIWTFFLQEPAPIADTPVFVCDKSNGVAEPVETVPAQIIDEAQLTGMADEPLAETEALLSDEQRTEKLAAAKSQLDDLILEYNAYLTVPELRADTQAQIDTLLKKYNELALPVVFAKINEK
jgi:hypothetical protein